MKHDDVVTDFGRLPNHHADRVVNEKAVTDRGGGVDIDRGEHAYRGAEDPSHQVMPAVPERVGDAMAPYCVKARVRQDNVGDATRGGVVLHHRPQVVA